MKAWRPVLGYLVLAVAASLMFYDRLNWDGGHFDAHDKVGGMLYAAVGFWLAFAFYLYQARTQPRQRRRRRR